MTVLEFKDRVDAIKMRLGWIERRRAELSEQINAISKESNDLYHEQLALVEAARTFEKYLGSEK